MTLSLSIQWYLNIILSSIEQVAQVVAYELGIPVTKVTIKTTQSENIANNTPTGGSVTSEEICKVSVV